MNNAILETIRQLEGERAKIDAALASLRALNGKAPRNTKTVIEGVIDFLRQAGKPQNIRQIRDELFTQGIRATPASIQTLLSRRASQKKDLKRKGHGVWTLR